MTFIGKNIRKIRNVKGLSQAAFAELFQITRASVGAYEEGRAEPKLEMIIQIAKYFSISIDLLLKKELTVNELYRFDIFDTDLKKKKGKGGDDEIFEEPQEIFMELVQSERILKYLKNYDNESFIMSLPRARFPQGFIEGSRVFELKGADGVSNLSCQIGDVIIVKKARQDDWHELELDRLHLFVSQEELIVNTPAALKEKLDGNFTPTEIWEVCSQLYMSRAMPKNSLEERVSLLEQQMQKILTKS